jgi:hypothetical protein
MCEVIVVPALGQSLDELIRPESWPQDGMRAITFGLSQRHAHIPDRYEGAILTTGTCFPAIRFGENHSRDPKFLIAVRLRLGWGYFPLEDFIVGEHRHGYLSRGDGLHVVYYVEVRRPFVLQHIYDVIGELQWGSALDFEHGGAELFGQRSGGVIYTLHTTCSSIEDAEAQWRIVRDQPGVAVAFCFVEDPLRPIVKG